MYWDPVDFCLYAGFAKSPRAPVNPPGQRLPWDFKVVMPAKLWRFESINNLVHYTAATIYARALSLKALEDTSVISNGIGRFKRYT